MRDVSLWRSLFGVEKTVIERVEFDEDEQVLVAHVRSAKRQRGRCGVCRRRSPGYDTGAGRRRWRALDLGTVVAVLEAEAPLVACGVHGVVVAHVPWARHNAGHTLATRRRGLPASGPRRSRAPDTRCGRTPKISPRTSR